MTTIEYAGSDPPIELTSGHAERLLAFIRGKIGRPDVTELREIPFPPRSLRLVVTGRARAGQEATARIEVEAGSVYSAGEGVVGCLYVDSYPEQLGWSGDSCFPSDREILSVTSCCLAREGVEWPCRVVGWEGASGPVGVPYYDLVLVRFSGPSFPGSDL